ncbi:hypothetical protein BU24DRAFT_371665 [Aaosphaeria arxii CBS 175.79]|uniref:YMC020W-like alpha/beta hydrolase domain-containing protein n=1 Tax=Aaosphaeria arxii CBS 175.79 TaxID=1450172 RepID=A0A6A5XPM7_9PLEO|nr:uncharacterized protein BU24DRAFT_371665 [Aaosphaeria arxii CBS 175.79]KAF2014859.1 hypothetical protein BU24DRAFT_371665 [Aaosphaeria arxii CBS 175.79]
MRSRKKSKTHHRHTNGETNDDISIGLDHSVTDGSSPNATGSASLTTPTSDLSLVSNTAGATDAQVSGKKSRRSWLGEGGSWRSKAPAIVKTARESIGVTGGATAELPNETTEHAEVPRKDVPAKHDSADQTKEVSTTSAAPHQQTKESNPSCSEPPLPPYPRNAERITISNPFAWRGWWTRPDNYTDSTKTERDETPSAITDNAQKVPLPVTPSDTGNAQDLKEPEDATSHSGSQMSSGYHANTEHASAQQSGSLSASERTDSIQPQGEAPLEVAPIQKSSGKSWFWLWSNTQNGQAQASTQTAPTHDSQDVQSESAQLSTSQGGAAENMSQEPLGSALMDEASSPVAQKPSGWAFWSRDRPKADQKLDEGSRKQVGEVAVFDTPSQSQPEAAQFNEHQGDHHTGSQNTSKVLLSRTSSQKASRTSKSQNTAANVKPDAPVTNNEHASGEARVSPTHSSTQGSTLATPPSAGSTDAKSPANLSAHPENLLLPEFSNTYQLVQKPTYWQMIRKYFVGGEKATPHLHISPDIPRIQRAVAIGVHGYFPAPIFQRVLGQPTGTSIRFANAARTAIEDWTKSHGYSVDIEQIALEGEGFIAERVNTLWKLLLNWIEHIKTADFILIACHSQGVPVAIMLVAKLIQFGCVSAARIGVCAMAGVNMGPFADYKTKYFGPTAAELFEFGDPHSLVSQMYLAALDEVLRYGVRILYVGSIDDQLVSLESSTFSALSHPYIYRAVFVDGRIHAPDFLTHLVGFTLKLRNLGLPDHGLIRELSPALAGSLYGGEGHSRVYEDPRVYKLAVEHALETTSLPISPQQPRPSTSGSFAGITIPIPGAKIETKGKYALQVKEYKSVGSGSQNPFYLPWAMRGLLEEDFVRNESEQEVEELLAMFEKWRPSTKQLKDVKFRLEGVRSRL